MNLSVFSRRLEAEKKLTEELILNLIIVVEDEGATHLSVALLLGG